MALSIICNIPTYGSFDTRISAAFALNLASAFIVKGSCAAQPSFPILPPLSAQVSTKMTGSSGPITFAFDTTQVQQSDLAQTLYIGWVNQANVINYQATTVSKGKVTSAIPSGMAGLAFAALTAQHTALDVNSLTSATLAGAAPVQIS